MMSTSLQGAEFQYFLEHAPVAVAMFDTELRYLAASRRWLSFHATDSPDIRGREYYQLSPGLAPALREAHRRALTGEATEQLPASLVAGGSKRELQWQVQPWHEQGGRIGGIIIAATENTTPTTPSKPKRPSKYQKMVEMANCAIIHWACDGTILFVNAFTQRLFGYGYDQMVGRSVDLIVPDKETGGTDLTGLVKAIVANPEDFANNLNENVCADGRRVWMTWTNRPLYNDNGEVTSILAVGVDITSQVRAEQMLSVNRAKLDTALESLSDAVFITDANGNFIDFNHAFATIHKFASKEECAKTFAEYPLLLDLFLPNGDPAPLEQWAVPRALRGETASNQEYTLRRRDTGETWVGSYSFAPLRDSSGEIVGSVVVGRDISESKRIERHLRESEERFRSMVEGAPDPIFIQTEGKFAYLNPAGCRLLGARYPEEVVGSSVGERFHPATRELVAERIRRLNRERQSVPIPLEHRMLRLDGSEVWVETKGEPIVYQGKNGALVFVRNVHERRLARQALEDSELRFRTLAEAAPVGVVITDGDDKVLFLNHHFTEILGYGIDDIPTVDHWWPLAYPDQELRSRAQESWNSSLKESASPLGAPEPSEFPIHCKDGTVRQIEFRKCASGPFNFAIITDITRRKNAEMATIKAAEDLRITLQSIGDAVITTDTQGRITRMNVVAEELCGWRIDVARQQPLERIFVIRNAKSGAAITSPAQVVLSTGQTVALGNDTTLFARDGRTYQIADSAAPVRDEDGQMRGVVLVFRDISESYRLREAMRREHNVLQLFVKYAPAAIAMFDREMRYISVSDRFINDYRIEEKNLIGRSHYQVFPEISERWKGIHRRCLQGAIERCDDDPFPRPDGKTDWVRWEIRPWYESNNEVGGILLFSELITDYKLAQDALLESERKIRFALEGTGMGAWDLNLHTLDMHRSIEHDRIFGYASLLPAWNFAQFLDHVHVEDRQRIQEKFDRASAGGSGWVAEFRIRRLDGELRWLWISGRSYQDTVDGTPHIAGFLLDISERKQSEARIEHINRVLNATRRINMLIVHAREPQNLLQTACDLLIETRGYRTAWAALADDAGQFSIFSHSGFGVEAEAFLAALQRGLQPLCQQLLGEEKSGVVSIADTRATCLACPLASSYPDGAALVGALRHDTRTYGLLVVSLPTGMADDAEERTLFAELTGDLGYALHSLEQEERRKQAEEHYGMLFRTSAEGILIADATTRRFLYANPRICNFLGYSEEELLTLDVSAIHPAEALPKVIEGFARQARDEIALVNDIPCLRRDGSIVYADINSVTITIQGRSCLAGFFHDNTARKEAEEVQAKLHRQLMQAQKMESVGRLAGGVAHDYNNMLNVIIGYTEIALETIDNNQPPYEELTEVLKAAKRSTEITRQLLAFARKQTIAPIILDLNDTITGMLKMLQRLIGEDISLNWHPKTGIWAVKMDPSQVDQILANLCVNSRDAIADTGKITIETDNVSFDQYYCDQNPDASVGDYVMLSVGDTGCGMDKETMDQIFEPFFTTKGVGRGTGLGMSTVYGIVRQNNGFISLYSEVGKGTTIKLYFPRHAGHVEVIADQKREVIKGAGETLLLVEDDHAVRKMAQAMLQRAGYTVLVADSAKQALELAKEHAGSIRLLITDVIMPEMNGKELAERLSNNFPNLKVLFMSGYTADAIAHHGVLDEDVNFIQKPFNQKDLAEKIWRVLRSTADNGLLG